MQVSETENIRKNLAIERMIVEGCDILLDVNQVFVRQGTLIQVSLGSCVCVAYIASLMVKEKIRKFSIFTSLFIFINSVSSGVPAIPTRRSNSQLVRLFITPKNMGI